MLLDSRPVPVLKILEEFRRLAGPRNRQRHKPTKPPVYDYIVRDADAAATAAAMAAAAAAGPSTAAQ